MNKEICVICNRAFTEGGKDDEHHLIPKSKGGKYSEKIFIHRICHDKIHTVWTDGELANYFHTVDRITHAPEIQAFIKWVAKKPLDFYTPTKSSKAKKSR